MSGTFRKIMDGDWLAAGVVKYVKMMHWLIPLSIIVPFLGFFIFRDSAWRLFEIVRGLLIWFYPLLFGGFLISIPFVFLEHGKSGFRCLATAVVSFLLVVIISSYPMNRISDGCSCGLRRSWYPWRGHKLRFTVEKEGNPNHGHRIWDPQLEISAYTPW